MSSWDPGAAHELVREHLSGAGDRWLHVDAVGRAAERLAAAGGQLSPRLVTAAWLHDLGYAESVRVSGFHPLDGARYLDKNGAPPAVVSLVAYHSGAEYEAEERGLADELSEIPRPDRDDLAVLTLLDFTNGPTGESTTVAERIDEILSRYDESDPVHRAVTRSRQAIMASCARASERTGHPM